MVQSIQLLMKMRRRVPPLVGYLVAGFVLYAVDVDPGEVIDHFAEMGVTHFDQLEADT